MIVLGDEMGVRLTRAVGATRFYGGAGDDTFIWLGIDVFCIDGDFGLDAWNVDGFQRAPLHAA